MPKLSADITGSSSRPQISVRFPPVLMGWVHTQLKELGAVSMNEALNRLLEEFRTWFSLPPLIVQRLEADREVLGLTRIEYIRHALAARGDKILQEGPGYEMKEAKKRK